MLPMLSLVTKWPLVPGHGQGWAKNDGRGRYKYPANTPFHSVCDSGHSFLPVKHGTQLAEPQPDVQPWLQAMSACTGGTLNTLISRNQEEAAPGHDTHK
jgi:hypothetical protein